MKPRLKMTKKQRAIALAAHQQAVICTQRCIDQFRDQLPKETLDSMVAGMAHAIHKINEIQSRRG